MIVWKDKILIKKVFLSDFDLLLAAFVSSYLKIKIAQHLSENKIDQSI